MAPAARVRPSPFAPLAYAGPKYGRLGKHFFLHHRSRDWPKGRVPNNASILLYEGRQLSGKRPRLSSSCDINKATSHPRGPLQRRLFSRVFLTCTWIYAPIAARWIPVAYHCWPATLRSTPAGAEHRGGSATWLKVICQWETIINSRNHFPHVTEPSDQLCYTGRRTNLGKAPEISLSRCESVHNPRHSLRYCSN